MTINSKQSLTNPNSRKMDQTIQTHQADNTLSAALHILTGDVCLQVGQEAIDKCRTLVIPPVPGSICPEALSTWLCDGAHFFTLFKPKGAGGSLVFSHTNEMLYHASIDAQLSMDCPEGLAFICQFTTDFLPEGGVPRLLAFDILSSQSPDARGGILREMQIHLPHPLCVVQWIGPRRYISPEFIAELPHKIKGVVALGDTPLAAGAWEN